MGVTGDVLLIRSAWFPRDHLAPRRLLEIDAIHHAHGARGEVAAGDAQEAAGQRRMGRPWESNASISIRVTPSRARRTPVHPRRSPAAP